MENNKYYTPTIEEFHVGFEYELPSNMSSEYFTNTFGDSNGEYTNELSEVHLGIAREQVKVKYLDQEDIESLGFGGKKVGALDWYFIRGRYEDGWASYGYWNEVILIHNLKEHKIKIIAHEYENDTEENTLFQGTCLNKSELKKILTQLNILKDE